MKNTNGKSIESIITNFYPAFQGKIGEHNKARMKAELIEFFVGLLPLRKGEQYIKEQREVWNKAIDQAEKNFRGRHNDISY